jgi:hypothetical protein
MKKYEIYLPIKYNDGTDIEPEKFFRDYKETLKEIFQQKEILITMQEIRTL